MKIGIFDSGIGGLSVFASIYAHMPQYPYVYFADDTHMPYGTKSSKRVFELTTHALKKMFDEMECNLVILACNTATTVLPEIQQNWLPKYYPNKKVLGIIRPTVEHIAKNSKKVLVMATSQTVKSHSYEDELAKIGQTTNIQMIDCPRLAKLIEENVVAKSKKSNSLLQKSLASYLTHSPDTKECALYTGCTHYYFVDDLIRALRPAFTLIHQGEIVALSLKKYLIRHKEIALSQTESDDMRFVSSSHSLTYEKTLHHIFRNVVKAV